MDILYTLIWAFILFSVIMLPTLTGYRSGTAYDGDLHVGHASSMISNLGYSEVECRNIPVSLGKVAITCPYGTVGKIFEYGVNSDEMGSPLDACAINDQNRRCKPTSNSIRDSLQKAIGKDSYTISFGLDDLYASGKGEKLCTDTTNLFFVQYSCIQSNDQQAEKYQHLITASASACLISLLFVVFLTKLYKGGKI